MSESLTISVSNVELKNRRLYIQTLMMPKQCASLGCCWLTECAKIMFSVLPDSEKDHLWDLWALDWVQQKAECLRFCVGRSVTPAGQLPVSSDIDYEFSSRNPYNFLQVTYYKVSYSSGSHVDL